MLSHSGQHAAVFELVSWYAGDHAGSPLRFVISVLCMIVMAKLCVRLCDIYQIVRLSAGFMLYIRACGTVWAPSPTKTMEIYIKPLTYYNVCDNINIARGNDISCFRKKTFI